MIFALYIKVLYTDKIENPTQQGKMLSWRCSQAYKIFKSLEKSKREDKPQHREVLQNTLGIVSTALLKSNIYIFICKKGMLIKR